MAEAILKDKHLIVPASAFLKGEYGLKDMFFGVPVQIGRGGLEKVVEYKLEADEKAAMEKSAAAVKESISVMQSLVKF
jgi:malate dehydrogenase